MTKSEQMIRVLRKMSRACYDAPHVSILHWTGFLTIIHSFGGVFFTVGRPTAHQGRRGEVTVKRPASFRTP